MSKPITLALQGGGSHGAFTWGVLDRLLEEEILQIKGISGTSAGALNGAILATGLVQGGPQRARECLDIFWEGVSEAYDRSSFRPMGSFYEYYKLLSDFWIGRLVNMMAPYDFSVSGYALLGDLLDRLVDYDLLRATDTVKIFVSATNVETNRIKVFTNKDLCTDSLLASACLPTVREAVKWQGQYYWDGGFMGNPILEPLIYSCDTSDLMIVQVNPINKQGVPKTSRQILDRLQEVTFNSSLMREIRGIVNIKKLTDKLLCSPENPYSKLRLHHIGDEAFMGALASGTKYNVNPDFLFSLKSAGRKAAARWIDQHLPVVGMKSSMNLEDWHLETPTTTCLEWD